MEGRVTKHFVTKFLFRQTFNLALQLIFLSFTVSGIVYFQEDFSDGDKWQERWVLSEHPNETLGFFILTPGKYYGHPEKCKGIQTFQDNKRYGISAKFPAFSNKGKPLIIQFTVKNEQRIKCAGTYIKLFNCSLEPTLLNRKTPYLLMFGPDKCNPTTYKTHVIFNYRGKYLDLKKQILHKEDHFKHLYTLIIYPDNTYVVKIDNKEEGSGKLKDDWNFLPPEYITDFTAEKPKNWDDRPHIYDVKDVKPEDWDVPPYIPDPDADIPDDWDFKLDGEWEPPLVENPDFKGDWKPRLIPNPNYKGKWVRPKIKNPKYFEDPELYKFDEICAVGIDVFQGQAGSIFDNILITDDMDYAEKHSWENWGSLRDGEKKMRKKMLEEVKHNEL